MIPPKFKMCSIFHSVLYFPLYGNRAQLCNQTQPTRHWCDHNYPTDKVVDSVTMEINSNQWQQAQIFLIPVQKSFTQPVQPHQTVSLHCSYTSSTNLDAAILNAQYATWAQLCNRCKTEIALLQYSISNLQQSGLLLVQSGPASWSNVLIRAGVMTCYSFFKQLRQLIINL